MRKVPLRLLRQLSACCFRPKIFRHSTLLSGHSRDSAISSRRHMASIGDPSHVIAYEYLEEVERLADYRPGGYHPVAIGDELCGRYQIVHKLGYGTFSTMWLARDVRLAKLVAIKVGAARSNSHEVDVLSILHSCHGVGSRMIPLLLDRFRLEGPNGVHGCYVTTPARCSLSAAKAASYIGLFQLEVARALAAQLTLAVSYMHDHHYIHGDLHLGNILLRLPSSFEHLSEEELYTKYDTPDLEPVVRLDGKPLPQGVPTYAVPPVWLGKPSENITLQEAAIWLSDFGESFSPRTETKHKSHTPIAIRPPETRFEPDRALGFPSEIWTLACSIWSIVAQRSLFDGIIATEDDITCEQVDALGTLPSQWWSKWNAGRHWYTEAGEPKANHPVRSWEDRFEDSIQEPRRAEGIVAFDLEERKAISDLLRWMLSFRPEDRPTITEVLKSDWMVRWAIPSYRQIRE